MRNAIIVARVNGLLLFAFGIFAGIGIFDSGETMERRLGFAGICAIGVVAGGALAWWGFRKRLPPKSN
jgi:hypothetical protein